MSSLVLDARLDSLRYAVFDLETTGLRPENSRIVEIAIALVEPDGSRTAVWHTLVDPGTEMRGTEIHGIRAEDVRDAPRFAEIADVVTSALAGRVVVAHNASFDIAHLCAELARSGVQPAAWPLLCTMLMTVDIDLDVTDRKLATCLEAFGLPGGQAHAALHDAVATGALLSSYLAVAPGLTVEDLTSWEGPPAVHGEADDLCLENAPTVARPELKIADLDAIPTCAPSTLVARMRQRRFQPSLDELLRPRCPRCEARLVQRRRRRDDVTFLSCLRYPACRFATDL